MQDLVHHSPSIPLWKTCAQTAADAQMDGDLETAEAQYCQSISLACQTRGSVHEDVGEALINLADFYMMLARYSEAEDHYKKALDVYETLFGKDNLIAAMIYRVLAEIYLIENRVSEAESYKEHASVILGGRQQLPS